MPLIITCEECRNTITTFKRPNKKYCDKCAIEVKKRQDRLYQQIVRSHVLHGEVNK